MKTLLILFALALTSCGIAKASGARATTIPSDQPGYTCFIIRDDSGHPLAVIASKIRPNFKWRTGCRGVPVLHLHCLFPETKNLPTPYLLPRSVKAILSPARRSQLTHFKNRS